MARVLSGEATPAERQELQRWLEEDAEHRRLYRDMERLWDEAGKVGALADPDLDREWSLLRRRLSFAGTRERALLKVVRRKRRTTMLLRMAAAVVFLLFVGGMMQMFFGLSGQATVTAGRSAEEITLSDGTRIVLAPGSRLVHPRHFREGSREVELQGIALFEVSRDTTRPFLVHAGEVDVRVLGTRFTVRMIPEERVAVDLLEGSVAVSTKQGDELRLRPGEEAVWSREQLLHRKGQDPNFLAWKTQRMVFDATPLRDVLQILREVYDTPFTMVSRDAAACRVTAIFDGASLDEVLATLSGILDITFRKEGKGYRVTGAGCHSR